MSIFEKASSLQLRFASTKGSLSVEDLWGLSLESLDTLAKAVNKQIKAEEEDSFIGKKSSANSTLDLKLDILKRVIEVKIIERDAQVDRAAKNAKLSQLKALALHKANEKLSSLSEEEINKMINELEE